MQFYIYLAKKQIFYESNFEACKYKIWDILGCFHYILNAPRTYIYINSHNKMIRQLFKLMLNVPVNNTVSDMSGRIPRFNQYETRGFIILPDDTASADEQTRVPTEVRCSPTCASFLRLYLSPYYINLFIGR